ncbi:MAG: hypothetical protein JW801_12635, partial [Bacteroidales bacterium]|nr:hypothetical protein [Bacteroidales bacterium]MBN2862642.1 hypothetical protein [Bacteroidales bacterium]
KVNDKEVAVLGSMVKTCNDPQPQETCSIIAVGAAVAIPFMPPGFDPEQYKRDGGFMLNTREPVYTPGAPNSLTDERSLSSPEWSESKVSVGHEVILSVNVQSQQGLRGDVQFKIFAEGADPKIDPPVATKSVRKDKGLAEVKWCPQEPNRKAEVEEAKFFFVAWAFGCEKVESGNLTVEKEVPEFSELKWELLKFDEEGKESGRKESTSFYVGDSLCLSAKAKRIDDEENVYLKVYEIPESGDKILLHQKLVSVAEGTITYLWDMEWPTGKSIPDEPVVPKLLFTLKSQEYKDEEAESPEVEVYERIMAALSDESGKPLKKVKYKLLTKAGDTVRESETDDEGKLLEEELGRTNYYIEYEKPED